MTQEEINDVIGAYAQAAKDAREIGFDGLEIHGAHGYLIDQFFWSHTNHRKDIYGGNTLAKRTRFAVEVVQAVRHAVGENFSIGFRFSQWKLGDYKAKLFSSPEELDSFLKPLVDAGVDLFHCSTRRFWEPEFSNSPLNLAAWTKKLTGKPTITVGSIGLDTDFVADLKMTHDAHFKDKNSSAHLFYLMECLKKEEFDLVAVGRSLLADPQWFQKLKEKRFDQMKPFSQEMLKTLF